MQRFGFNAAHLQLTLLDSSPEKHFDLQYRIRSASLLAKLPMVRPLSKVMAKYACDLDRAVCFLCNAPG